MGRKRRGGRGRGELGGRQGKHTHNRPIRRIEINSVPTICPRGRNHRLRDGLPGHSEGAVGEGFDGFGLGAEDIAGEFNGGGGGFEGEGYPEFSVGERGVSRVGFVGCRFGVRVWGEE